MLAELHGKFDPSNSDYVDRSEDTLTSAVFGAIRYLPRQVLGRILTKAGVTFEDRHLAEAKIINWPKLPFSAWHREIEPDVLVVVGKQTVVFEAKLHSPFGLYPLPDQPDSPPVHQLAVQYAAASEWTASRGLRLPPIVVCVTAPPERPARDLAVAESDVRRLSGRDAASNTFRWLPWYGIGGELEKVPGLAIHERALVEDTLSYMEKKGVRRVFEGFKAEDYWLLSRHNESPAIGYTRRSTRSSMT